MEMMRQKPARRFPFAALGFVLIAASAAPTIIGMVRAFEQVHRGEDVTAAVKNGVTLALHPAFATCGLIGLLLVIIEIARTLRRRHRPVTQRTAGSAKSNPREAAKAG
jgi:hypothetical protein